jgi:hypothetical protein
VTQGPSEPLYKGEPLAADRGPGLGCFWLQIAVLGALLVLTPLSVVAAAPVWLSAGLLIVTLILLLFAGQTVIFLLRLVAADRRTRRRPLAATARPTVGDLEAGVADESLAWTELDLTPSLRELYETAAAEARLRLERAEPTAFAVVTTDEGRQVVERQHLDDAIGEADAVATVAFARVLVPGVRRPTDAIRIELETREGSALTVAIRYESEGPPRYRFWEPVMAVHAPALFGAPPAANAAS